MGRGGPRLGHAARRLVTYQDVLDAPEGITAEILAGELHLSPRPRASHQYTEGVVASDLDGPFQRGRGGPGGWWILREPEIHLGKEEPTSVVAAPDLAGWRRERMPWIPDAAALELPPDWICEILSPGAENARRDRVVKPDLYASAGVAHLWIVDPAARTLEVWGLRGDTYARLAAFAGDDHVRAAPFDAVELDLSGWWLPGPPAAP